MRTVPKNEWPIWMKNRLKKRKNIEVKESGGHFYLYEYKNIWDKIKKRPVKKTKYVCVLREMEKFRVLEHGHVSFLLALGNDEIKKLEKHFPEEWRHITVFLMNRTIQPMPLKRIGSWFEKTSLPKLLHLERITSKTLSKMLRSVGENDSSQKNFMKELIKEKEILLYDGSVIFSHSKYNRLLEVGYNKAALLLPKANIGLLFSKTRGLPVYFKLFAGSIHEIRTTKELIDELRGRHITLIGDKGYYKNELFRELNEVKIKFIIPLPRDDRRINYKKKLIDVFEYHNRIIKSTSYSIDENFHIYLFEDQLLKYEETTEYYKIKLSKKKISFNEEWAGKVALISNIKKIPQEIYLMWKTRDEIEKSFHILENILELDTPYVSDEDVFRGYVFVTFVSLILYYRVLNLLKKKGLNRKISVGDLLFELSKIMVHEKSGVFLEIPKRTQRVVEKIGADSLIGKIGWS